MDRPQRQIIDHALGNPAEHWPLRPFWFCVGCGVDWPCVPYRKHLRSTLGAQEIMDMMAPYSRYAVIELAGKLPRWAVQSRMFDWIYDEEPRPFAGWHPPGGSI